MWAAVWMRATMRAWMSDYAKGKSMPGGELKAPSWTSHCMVDRIGLEKSFIWALRTIKKQNPSLFSHHELHCILELSVPFLCRQRNLLTFKLRILKEQKDWSENTLASEGLIWGKGWQTIPFGAKGKMQLETYHLVACLGIFQTYYWLISKLRINLEEEWWIPNFSNHTLPNKL